jgi:hypothetical protein
MICQRCQGFGRLPVLTEAPHYRLDPCPDCNGCGVTSCCGDEIAQPEKENHDG